MSTGRSGPRYQAFLRAAERWTDELEQLRRIVLECGLTEEVKWGAPCFTADGGNVVILGVLNDREATLTAYANGAAELTAALDGDPALRGAWEGLTPGRRRGWLVHISGAKQPASRVAKGAPRILAGKGMHDR